MLELPAAVAEFASRIAAGFELVMDESLLAARSDNYDGMARASLFATLLQPTNIVRKWEASNLLHSFRSWPINGQKSFPSTVWREPCTIDNLTL